MSQKITLRRKKKDEKISWNDAIELWVQSGKAKKFAEAYKEDKKYLEIYKEIMKDE